jgi:hypothetical protein
VRRFKRAYRWEEQLGDQSARSHYALVKHYRYRQLAVVAPEHRWTPASGVTKR